MPESVNPSNRSEQSNRLKLFVPPPNSTTLEKPDDHVDRLGNTGSPPRPSYSPVTPTLGQGYPIDQADTNSVQWRDDPVSQSVDLDDSSDAIALRAAISTLQLQKQQAQRDIKNLEKMKRSALENPETFVENLKAGNLTSKPRQNLQVDLDSENEEDESQDTSIKFPSAQNVIRTPPIEWSKYHVVGEALDKIHSDQIQYPGNFDQTQPYQIAAPYRPFKDKIEDRKKMG